ncbi:Uncharacterized [Syntrophomonas zehnderi OL-4]|uniref:Uncharacterized n=1 Tax=Syntrophomonas zehnderi OL-4 TaxID=690567 RepID=A0A0E4GBU5_9FIRM|nr:hypothetical protein [Syntrophomonas zehnderi]CFX62107.1 Uncharacterized [Syntrophomonas zehnderi OL-4]
MLRHSKVKSYIILLLALLLVMAPVFSVNGAGGANVSKVQDNELVISTLNDTGSIDDIKVLSHMRVSGNGNVTIQDQSQYKLKSVRNLYGSEKITQKDGALGINFKLGSGEGHQDVYYLAALDKNEISRATMPVSIKVSYFLDGQQIKPSKLAGKSGHLKIVCEVENLTGSKKTLEFKNNKGEMVKSEAMVYTPYVVSLSGWEFDNKKFSAIQAPGVAEESPEGVIVDVQGKTSVSWSVPLVPPKYPAKQYVVLEADAKKIELPSYKIAVIPIVPTTSEIDSLGTVQESFGKLYDAFDKIQGGVGTPAQDATLLNGLNAVKNGLGQVSDGMGSLVEKLTAIRLGLSNPKFDVGTYNSATGTDAKGNTPAVREAITISKNALDEKITPALEGQKKVLTVMEATMGKPGGEVVQPSLSTSLYNDVSFMQGLVKGTPAEDVITKAMAPKIMAMGANLGVLRDGGNLVTAGGSMPFPASINAIAAGVEQISSGLGKANSGVGMIALGLGQIGADGKPVKVMMDGKPGSILYALAYLQESIDGKMVPGIDMLSEGTAKIGDGSSQAKEAITGGLEKMMAAPAIVSALKDNASQANSFLGKPEGAEGTVAYVFQTPEVNTAASAMNYGLGAIVLALIILFAIGRPKSPSQFTEVNKEM